MAARRTPPSAAKQSATESAAGEQLARAFSELELLAAADVIRSAIAEGRQHVDLQALRSVLAKLNAAHEWRQRAAG